VINRSLPARLFEIELLARIEALILVAEHGGPTMFARIGMMRALYRDAPAPRR
jgi:hypothetical protein